MTPEEQQRHETDLAAQGRAQEKRDERLAARDFSKLSPERQEEETLQRKIDAAVDARIARLVFQSGAGIQVTGGNGNFTIAVDPAAFSMSGSGVCGADGTSTFTFTLTV